MTTHIRRYERRKGQFTNPQRHVNQSPKVQNGLRIKARLSEITKLLQVEVLLALEAEVLNSTVPE
jgi:hypothetical protein